MLTGARRRALSGVIFSILVSTSYADLVYWTDGSDSIKRGDTDSGQVEAVISGLSNPWGIALSRPTSQIYFSNNGTDKIMRVNADGTGLTAILSTVDNARQMDIDVAAGKIYWAAEGTADGGQDSIYRANLDGTNVQPIVSGLWNPRGLALDLIHHKVYFDTFDLGPYQRQILSANLDGSDVQHVLWTGSHAVWGIAVDPEQNLLYWSDALNDVVGRATLQGSDAEDVLTGIDSKGVTIDSLRQTIYATGGPLFPSNGLAALDLSGNQVRQLFPGENPLYTAVVDVPEPASLGFLAIGGWSFLRRKRLR